MSEHANRTFFAAQAQASRKRAEDIETQLLGAVERALFQASEPQRPQGQIIRGRGRVMMKDIAPAPGK